METKTQIDNAAVVLTQPNTNGAMEKVNTAPAPLATREIVWSRERIELVKRQLMPQGTSDDEFAIFLEQCKRTQLDPLIGEAFCVPRNSKVKKLVRGVEVEEWITKNVFQAAVAGMEARADRFPEFAGLRYGVIRKKDSPAVIDTANGIVEHKFNPCEDRGVIVGAWAVCSRRDRLLPPVWVPLAERLIANKAWSDKTETMIGKCARAAALRQAFPNVFAGVYIREEMENEEVEINPAPTGTTPEQQANEGRSRTDRVADKVAAAATAAKAAPAAKPPPTPEAEAKPPPPAGQTIEADTGPTIIFGEKKGTPVAKLSDAELLTFIATGEKQVSEFPGARWASGVGRNIGELRAELLGREDIRQREASATAEKAMKSARTVEREPGSDDGDEEPPHP